MNLFNKSGEPVHKAVLMICSIIQPIRFFFNLLSQWFSCSRGILSM